MARWDETDHPRRPDGEFADKTGGWVRRVDRQIGRRVTPSAVFDTLDDPETAEEPAPEALQAAVGGLRQMFDFSDPETGYKAKVAGAEWAGDGYVVRGEITGGYQNGSYEIAVRLDDDGSRMVAIEDITLGEDQRGQGFTTRWMRKRLEPAWKAEGVARVELMDASARRYWDRLGYSQTSEAMAVMGKELR